MKETLNRKEFLERISMLCIGVVGAGTVFTSCGKKEEPEAKTETPAAAEKQVEDPCGDLSGLTEDEKAIRDTFKYVAQSPDPNKLCTNCQFWSVPKEGENCGGCQIIKGPINPDGYCNQWLQKQT
jgi:hypothetical protein